MKEGSTTLLSGAEVSECEYAFQLRIASDGGSDACSAPEQSESWSITEGQTCDTPSEGMLRLTPTHAAPVGGSPEFGTYRAHGID